MCDGMCSACGAEGAIQEEHQLLEKWFRDIKVYDIFEGTGQIQRIVISKRLIAERVQHAASVVAIHTVSMEPELRRRRQAR